MRGRRAGRANARDGGRGAGNRRDANGARKPRGLGKPWSEGRRARTDE